MCDYDLQWTQPLEYRRALQSELLRKNPTLYGAMWPMALALFVLIGGSFWLELRLGALSWGLFVVCALGMSYVLSRLSMRARIAKFYDLMVVLSAAGVQSFRFMSVGKVPGELFPWERIGRCRAVLEEVAGKAFPVLIVESWEGREMARFGLDERPSIAEIRDWLKSAERELADETGLSAPKPAASAV